MLTHDFQPATRRARDHRLAVAVLASLAAHVAVIGALPGRTAPSAPRPPALTVGLAQVVVGESRLLAEPEVGADPQHRLKLVPRVEPSSVQVARQEPRPVPAASLPAAVDSTVPPERGAAVPRVSGPTAAAAVSNEPKAAAGSAPAASDGEAFLAYRRLLAKAITAHQSYPRLARLHGWQGTVDVELHIATGDTLRDVLVTRSSGFDVLDRSALDMVRQARPLPAAPEPLRSREFSVTVPIAFRLTD